MAKKNVKPGQNLARPIPFTDRCRRYMYLVILAGFAVASAVKIYIGCWVLIDPEFLMYQLWGPPVDFDMPAYLISMSKVFRFNVYLLIASNVFCFLLPTLGFIAVKKTSIRFYRLYIMLTTLSSILMTVFCFIGTGFNLLIYDDVQRILKDVMMNYFDGIYNSSSSPSQYWYKLQQTYSCCGINGVTDYTENGQQVAAKWFSSRETSSNDDLYYNATVPASCCKSYGNGTLIDKTCPYNGTIRYANVYSYFERGCQDVAFGPLAVILEEFNTYILQLYMGVLDCILHVQLVGFMLRKRLMKIPEVPIRRKSIAVPRAIRDMMDTRSQKSSAPSESDGSTTSPASSDCETPGRGVSQKPSLRKKASIRRVPENQEVSPRIAYMTERKPPIYIAEAYVYNNEAMTSDAVTADTTDL